MGWSPRYSPSHPCPGQDNGPCRNVESRTGRANWASRRGDFDFWEGCLRRPEEQRMLQAWTGSPRSTGKPANRSVRGAD